MVEMRPCSARGPPPTALSDPLPSPTCYLDALGVNASHSAEDILSLLPPIDWERVRRYDREQEEEAEKMHGHTGSCG